jgi:hypothetical protein
MSREKRMSKSLKKAFVHPAGPDAHYESSKLHELKLIFGRYWVEDIYEQSFQTAAFDKLHHIIIYFWSRENLFVILTPFSIDLVWPDKLFFSNIPCNELEDLNGRRLKAGLI